VTFVPLLLPLAWAIAVALIAGLVAAALSRWLAGLSLAKRILFAVMASTLPSFGIVGFYVSRLGLISLWFSPDEFLIPFTLHILLVVAISAPIAWLISRRRMRPPMHRDVFD